MKFSVSVDAVYAGRDFVESLHEIKYAGGTAFEFWGWWDKDLGAIRAAMERLELTAVCCCTRFISLVDPAQRDAYLEGLQASISVAQQLGCTKLISQVGNDLGTARAAQQHSLIEGLQASVPLLAAADIELVIEPLNVRVDHPGYYLTDSDEGFEIITAVNSPHVKLLFDIYHQQITEGDVTRRIIANIDKIGHFHAAGNPGRHELHDGELNYPAIFRAIADAGYQGYVGLEYFPLDEPLLGLQRTLSYG